MQELQKEANNTLYYNVDEIFNSTSGISGGNLLHSLRKSRNKSSSIKRRVYYC